MKKNLIVIVLGMLGVFLIMTLIFLRAKEIKPNQTMKEVSTVTKEPIDNTVIQKYTEAIKTALASSEKPTTIFDPTVSLAEEKDVILKMFVYPYNDFRNETAKDINLRAKVFIVHKNTGKEIGSTANSVYRIDIIGNNGQFAGESVGEVGKPLEYWTPSCLGDCKFSAAFISKYPELVKKYREINNIIK